jgi:hypothetical protein
MGNINPIFNDRVRYTLKSQKTESLIVTEPIGWNDDEKEFSRHEQYHGIIAKFSNSLKFIDSGADYIQLILDVYGINEPVELIREEKHPQTDVWTLTYSGFLDLSTWARENNQVSVKFNSGGIEQLLKSREGEKVEIDRETTIDGKVIPPLQTIDVELEGRRIFLKSKWETKEIDSSFDVNMHDGIDEDTWHVNVGVPIEIINKSHEEASSAWASSNLGDDVYDQDGVGTTGSMFFLKAKTNRTINLDLFIKLKAVATIDNSVDWSDLSLRLTRYDNNYNRIQSTILHYNHRDNGVANFSGVYHSHFGIYPNPNQFNFNNYPSVAVNYASTINLNIGDSLALEMISNADFKQFASRELNVSVLIEKCVLNIEENSIQEKTNTKAIFAHELAERLVTIGTNKEKSFYSDFLGRPEIGYAVDGKAALTALTHGFWLRGFDKLPEPTEGPPKVENLFKPLTTSFKEFVESMSAVWNIGIGIEKVGFKEIVRLEELSYFYNRNATIKLPNQVKNVKRTIATDKYYSSLEIGFEKGGDYEEACGLDEYNVKSTYTTCINRIKNVYNKISKYRADSYGIEFARRKQKSLNDTEDTTYDNDVFFLDLKRHITALFKERKWSDDFENAPTGVFSPETATNLRLSPFNCLIRHGWWFSGGLKKYLTEYVRYGSSISNSQLKTKLRTDAIYSNNPSNTPGNGNEYAENGNIVNSELKGSRFLPEEIEFEHICDFDVMQQVNGTTTILGKRIPNFYGLVEFINESNEIEKGFLFNLKPNGKGQWKLLKANR